jgi:hypothetical protein
MYLHWHDRVGHFPWPGASCQHELQILLLIRHRQRCYLRYANVTTSTTLSFFKSVPY